eukprot:TRINITY_DN10416_c0_g1_i1.p1 TRINITY_DN10416_c0_g1~~TRINITY_DN10416_c0_g1_i1.p1  ORF type:complete len:432 (-),score=110.08 TRINITY_DN10416_c0_g1_i1:43-1338(-)
MSSKRKAGEQVDRDQVNEEEEENTEQQGGTWKAAPSSVIAERRMVKAKRKKATHNEEPKQQDTADEEKETEEGKKVKETTTRSENSSDQPKENKPDFTFGGIGGYSLPSPINSSPSQWSFTYGTSSYVPLSTPEKKDENKTPEKSSESGTPVETKSWSFGSTSSLSTFSSSSSSSSTSSVSDSTIKWPTFGADKPATPEIKWPTFSTSWSFSSSTYPTFSFSTEPSQFKVESTIGTVSGVGSDADKTRELTSSVTSEWGRNIEPPKEPVVPSPSPTESPSKPPVLTKLDSHTTGEEGEHIECEVRGRLFEFTKEDDKPTWKERGIGPLKVNSNDSKQIYRIIMRTDNALRVILNGIIYSDIVVEKPTDKQVRFTSINTTTESNKLSTFLLKVANPSDACNLINAINKCKSKAKAIPTEKQTTTGEGDNESK